MESDCHYTVQNHLSPTKSSVENAPFLVDLAQEDKQMILAVLTSRDISDLDRNLIMKALLPSRKYLVYLECENNEEQKPSQACRVSPRDIVLQQAELFQIRRCCEMLLNAQKYSTIRRLFGKENITVTKALAELECPPTFSGPNETNNLKVENKFCHSSAFRLSGKTLKHTKRCLTQLNNFIEHCGSMLVLHEHTRILRVASMNQKDLQAAEEEILRFLFTIEGLESKELSWPAAFAGFPTHEELLRLYKETGVLMQTKDGCRIIMKAHASADFEIAQHWLKRLYGLKSSEKCRGQANNRCCATFDINKKDLNKAKLHIKSMETKKCVSICRKPFGKRKVRIEVLGDRPNVISASEEICQCLSLSFWEMLRNPTKRDRLPRVKMISCDSDSDSGSDYFSANESLWSPSSCDSDSDQEVVEPEVHPRTGYKFNTSSTITSTKQHGSNQELEVQDADTHIEIPDCMNILFLGSTGVGKSTAINSLVNYLTYPNISDAVKDPLVLIRSSFYVKSEKVVVESTLVSSDHGDNLNENTAVGASATQDPKSYQFYFDVNGTRKSINIIDTPGIGDSRGIEYDKQNFSKIVSYIADFSEIHAICILLPPDSCRLTPVFRFCIDELLVHLHQSAAQNIIFYFTSTRSTGYIPGSTFAILEKHIENLLTSRNITIKLDRSTMFHFDNEGFKYMCAVKNGMEFSNKERKPFEESYAHSVKETRRWMSRIGQLNPHKVSETLCLNNTRSLILALARPLAEISRNISLNKTLLKEKIAEIESLIHNGDDLTGKLFVRQATIETKEIPYPKTVCTSRSCVSYRKFHPDSDVLKTVYDTICHDHCYLTDVPPEQYPEVKLQRCWAMNGKQNCRECKCSWQSHMHIRYEIIETMNETRVKEVEEKMRDNCQQIKQAGEFVANMRERIGKLDQQSQKILKYSAVFATFLHCHSIIPYSHSFKQYLQYLLKQEMDMASETGNYCMVDKLKRYEAEYDEEVMILRKTNSSANMSNLPSIEQVNEMITELKTMPFGTTLSDVQKLVVLSVRQSRAYKSVVVNVAFRLWDFTKGTIAQLAKPFNWFSS